MMPPLLHPAFVLAIAFAGLWTAAVVGALLSRKVTFGENLRHDFAVVLTAALTLLALLIGFSFSMAASRYDQRKNLEEEEANAIGTEYLRADLLGTSDGAKLRELLKKYLELRVRFYTADHYDVPQIDAQAAQLQKEMWTIVVPSANRQGNAVIALAVSGMNDVINAQGYIQAAWWNRIPGAAWAFMGLIAVGCNVLLGYGLRSVTPRSPVLMILPLLAAVSFMLIHDIDTPRLGPIKIPPKNLLILLDSLKTP